jgi:glutamate-1-semialdehyde aminotransferase
MILGHQFAAVKDAVHAAVERGQLGNRSHHERDSVGAWIHGA